MAQCELNPRSISSKSPSFALLITLLLWDSYAFAAIFRRIERKTSYDDHVILLFSIFIFYIFIFHSNNSDTQICICMNDQWETTLFFLLQKSQIMTNAFFVYILNIRLSVHCAPC